MKKTIFIIITVILVAGILGGVYFSFRDYKVNGNKYELGKYLKNTSMIIKEGTLTDTGCTIIITDTEKEEKHTYGEDYDIYVYKDDKWKSLRTGDGWHNLIGYLVNKDNKLEMDINWESAYGKLEPGKYKLVKEAGVSINDSYVGDAIVEVEFEI